MDTVIFSGKISKAELLEERGSWFERLCKEDKLEALKVKGMNGKAGSPL